MSDSDEEPGAASTKSAAAWLPTALALERLYDIIEFEIEHILFDDTTRLDHYESLVFFWSQHPAKGIQVGRIFARLVLAELLVIACGENPYGSEGGGGANGSSFVTERRYDVLYKKDRQSWEDLELDTLKLKSLLLRKDASKKYLDESEVTEDGAELDEVRSQLPAFRQAFDDVIRAIQVNRAISPIREKLEDEVASNMNNFNQVIDQDSIVDVIQYLENIGKEAQEDVLTLFRKKADNDFVFVTGRNMEKILQSKTFDLEYFQKKFDKCLRDMNRAVFGPTPRSILLRLEYMVEPGSHLDKKLGPINPSRRKAARANLRLANDRLTHGHGPDPLEESILQAKAADASPFEACASSAPRLPGKTSGTPRNAPVGEEARQLEFRSDEESNPTAQSAQSTSHSGDQKNSSGDLHREKRLLYGMDRIAPGKVPPDEGIFRDDGRVAKRQRWTDEEKQVIIDGVSTHGFQWAVIKKEHGHALRNRTNVQIKDCFRTMIKRGEIKKSDFGLIDSGDENSTSS